MYRLNVISGILFYLMSFLHAASTSCCQYQDPKAAGCEHVIQSRTARLMTPSLQTVVNIPSQACKINITEHNRSNNRLVVKIESGRNILNDSHTVYDGKYSAAGTVFYYSRAKGGSCPGECLLGDGPIKENIVVQMLYGGYSPGITYEYYAPKGIEIVLRKPLPQRLIHEQPQNQQPYRQPVPNTRRIIPSFQPPRGAWHTANKARHGKFIRPRGQSPRYNPARSNSYGRLPPRHLAPYNNRQYGHYVPGARPVVSPNINRRMTLNKNRTDPRVYNSRQRLSRPIIIPSRTHGHVDPRVGNRQPFRHNPHQQHNRQIYPSQRNQQYLPRIIPNRNLRTDRFSSVDGGVIVRRYPTYVENTENLQHRFVSNRALTLEIPDQNKYESYEWKIAGFTDCSRTCGSGIQQTKIVCVKIRSQVTVTAENCNYTQAPSQQEVTCNKEPCPPSWQIGNWSACSTSCGSGTQMRAIECTQTVSRDTTLKVSAERCRETKRPAIIQQCQNDPCAKWLVKKWGKCKPECGPDSIRRRFVKCVSGEVGTSLPGRYCPQPRPHRTERCGSDHCPPKWYVSEWSGQCSSNCGEGFTTRQVICATNPGELVQSTRCDLESKPSDRRSCRSSSHPCGGAWFVGHWSQCSAKCGTGQRTRDVACLKRYGQNLLHVVPDENCQREKPITQENCIVLTCGAEWFMTEWSECSVTCDQGVQTREAKCLDKEYKPSKNCSAEILPIKTKRCIAENCHRVTTVVDHLCVDKYGTRNCQLAMRARLCKNPLYKEQCCVTCSQGQQHIQ